MTHRFKAFLAGLRVTESPKGDFIGDMLRDRKLPDPGNWQELAGYFEVRWPYPGARAALRSIWLSYCKLA